jgi:DNA-binding SARP family transcriptional activator
MLKIHLLGHFKVLKGEDAVEVPSRPAQSLFAYLAISAGTVHRREKLAGLLWPEASESNARSNLRHALWRLRKAVGNEYLIADKITVAFDEHADYWLDVNALSREEHEGRTTEELLEQITHYGGELLPGFYDDWVILERERYRALFDNKVQKLLDQLVKEERWGDVLEWGERWIAMGHAPEPAYRALMFAYCGLGDTAGMANTYQRCVTTLKEELGVEPSGETKAAYEYLANGGAPTAPQWTATSPVREVDASSAVRSLLKQWRTQGVEVMDIASLAIVQASPSHLPFEDEHTELLIRSALHHAIELGPWLERVRTEDVAVEALLSVYDGYPKPRVRARIVEALKGLESEAATQGLLRIAMEEDAGSVRAEAAVAAAERGKVEAVTEGLLEGLGSNGRSAAMAAFVAIADEVGLPEDIGDYPKIPVFASIAYRRWRANKDSILVQLRRAGLWTALISAAYGFTIPLFVAIFEPQRFQAGLDIWSIPAWSLAGGFTMLFIGGVQGLFTGFTVGLADAIFGEGGNSFWRVLFGGVSGLDYAAYLIIFSLTGLLEPSTQPSIYIPVHILYGILIGALISFVIPELGKSFSKGQRIKRMISVGIPIVLLTIPQVFVVYHEYYLSKLPDSIVRALLLPIGIGIGVGYRNQKHQIGQE